MRIKSSVKWLLSLVLLSGSFFSHSALIISSGNQSPLCSNSTIDNVSSGRYVGCTGSFSGNDSNQQVDVMNALDAFSSLFGTSGTWGFDPNHKSDAYSNGMFTSNPGTNAGTLTFDSSIEGLFAIALKAGNAYSLFFFESNNDGISSFDYTTDGVNVNHKNVAKALSHASLYSFAPTRGEGNGPTTEVVNTPNLLALISIIVGLLVVRKSKLTLK